MRLFTLILILLTVELTAQTTADFESFNLPQDTFLNGSDGSGGFDDGNIRLHNSYNDEWDSWSGWAISTMTDTITPGFTNQYSCISGGGANDSDAYATAFVDGESLLHTTGEGRGVVEGFYINNATYAYLSMLEGDAFAKKFGGVDGTDPDYFYLSIKEHGRRNVNNDSLIFYLADFRSDNPEEDYILNEWTYVSLEQFENVDTLSFQLYTSDKGLFGNNTPSYFCIDELTTTDMALTSVKQPAEPTIDIFPNPTSEQINCRAGEEISFYSISDINGKAIVMNQNMNQAHSINVSLLDAGVYILNLAFRNGSVSTTKFIKQ